jgi:NTP pyrophosphatase (non-canonical NTP hydrolase)
MKELLEAIRWLYYQDAVHRKGFRIREATAELAASNGVEELGELLVELVLKRPEQAREELVDVVAIVAHLTILMNADWEELEREAIAKIRKRFSVK